MPALQNIGIFLFLRRKKKTVGTAKICFERGRFQITGSKIDTNGFGLWSELDRLKNIIRPGKNLSHLEP